MERTLVNDKKLRGLLISLAAGIFLISGLFTAARAAVIITSTEIGGNVVLSTQGGSLDLTGLSMIGTGTIWGQQRPSNGWIVMGSPVPTSPAVDFYSGFSGPASFGSGSSTRPGWGTGDIFGFTSVGGGPSLALPSGFVSGNTLGSGSSTYVGQTFASLGMTQGSYQWSWAGDSVMLNVGTVPVPAAVWLFGSALGLLGWMRRKQSV